MSLLKHFFGVKMSFVNKLIGFSLKSFNFFQQKEAKPNRKSVYFIRFENFRLKDIKIYRVFYLKYHK